MRYLFFFLLSLTCVFDLYSKVFVFGDSHCVAYTIEDANLLTKHPYLRNMFIKWLGPITMHRVGRDGLNFLDVRNYGVNERDVVLFVFGEVDVRCHIGKIRDTHQKSLEDVLTDLVQRYLSTVLANRALFQNVHMVVAGVVPPTDAESNPSAPTYGSLADRVDITKKLNALLKSEAEKVGVSVIDAYTSYVDANGLLAKELNDGMVHISRFRNHALINQLGDIVSQTLS